MPRLRSAAVVALLWVAALAGSSAPDGFSGPGLTETPLVAGTAARVDPARALGRVREGGKRWVMVDRAGGKRWL